MDERRGYTLSALVTGGSGFIGSHLVERLLADGYMVTSLDNYSTGQSKFLKSRSWDSMLRTETVDLLDQRATEHALIDKDIVFHFAGYADIRHNVDNPRRQFEINTVATFNILEAAHKAHVKHVVFSSTGAVYGLPLALPIRESGALPSVQVSLYGASKLASEAFITAYCRTFGIRSTILRFVPILGERYSHGHIFDFVKKLKLNPECIDIFGTGQERKYCIYAKDAIDAIILATNSGYTDNPVFNVGNDSNYTIDNAVDWVASEMGLSPRKIYSGQRWFGDNPDLYLDSARIKTLGWQPQVSIKESVRRTVSYLLDNPWLLEQRA